MDIQIAGKNMDLGDALQAHVKSNLSEGIHKYFDRDAEAHVTFTKERSEVLCEVVTHLASGVFLSAHGEGGDAYGAFDMAQEKIEKRVRRYKRRLKDHHNDVKDPLPAENASYFTIAAPTDASADGQDSIEDSPLIIAESETAVRAMTVSDAVMQLDLSENPAFMFKNAAHGRLNIVYRRPDGNIGWIDPS